MVIPEGGVAEFSIVLEGLGAFGYFLEFFAVATTDPHIVSEEVVKVIQVKLYLFAKKMQIHFLVSDYDFFDYVYDLLVEPNHYLQFAATIFLWLQFVSKILI